MENHGIEIYKADENDIEQLILFRLDYLRMDRGRLSIEEERIIPLQLHTYFTKHLPLEDFIALIARVDGKPAACAFMVIGEKPASPAFITGLTGTLLNVMTYPAYRRKGVATQVVMKLIDEAKKRGVSSIELTATKDGKHVYEKIGFAATKYTAMRLQFPVT